MELLPIEADHLGKPQDPRGLLGTILPSDPLQALRRDDYYLWGQRIMETSVGGIGGIDDWLHLQAMEFHL